MSTITVNGTGSVRINPDLTYIFITIERNFPHFAKAYAQAKENGYWMSKILEYNNLNPDQAKTIRFDIIDYLSKNRGQDNDIFGSRPDAYSLHQQIKIELTYDNAVTDSVLRGIGKYISGAQISIKFDSGTLHKHNDALLADAVADATRKARAIAAASNKKLGEIESIICDQEPEIQLKKLTNLGGDKSIISKNDASITAANLTIAPENIVVSGNVTIKWTLE